MRTRTDRRLQLDDGGYTLVELTVVILLIAILAGIAIPSFLGIQRDVREASTESDLGSNRTALVAYSIDNNGLVPAPAAFDPSANGSNLVGYGWQRSQDTVSSQYSTNTARTAWCLEMTSSTGSVFRVSGNSTVTAGTCASLGVSNY